VRYPALLIILTLSITAALLSSAHVSASEDVPVNAGSTRITGQDGNILVMFVSDGDELIARLCQPIESNNFVPADANFSDIPEGENPCGDPTPDTMFPPGDYDLTAGVFVPGEQTPVKSIETTFAASEFNNVRADGAALSADIIGDTDCDRDIDSVDGLNVLKFTAAIGEPADCVESAGNPKCDDDIGSVDALFILRSIAALANNFPAGCAPLLVAPNIVAPESDTVFTNFPREFEGEWSAVPDADQYIVQLDCEHCCEIGDFCAEQGRGYLNSAFPGTMGDLVVTADNNMRMRVWAIDEDGNPGVASSWRTFSFDTP
jgi:hypothetical protein